MSDIITDVIRHKREAERLFCACVLSQSEMVKHDCGWLKADRFSDERYRKFWGLVMGGKDENSAAIDAQIYTDLIGAQLEIISSLSYNGFAQTIAEDDWMLSIAQTMPKIAGKIAERNKSEIQKLLEKITDEKINNGISVPTAVDVGMAFAELVGKENAALLSFIPPFDENLGGFVRGTVNVIGARPSMGKTALTWQIARNMVSNGNKVIYFSLEMKATTLWARAACGLASVKWKDVILNRLDQRQQDKLLDESGKLMSKYGNNLLIDDRSRITSEDLWQTVAEYKPDAIFVDHASLLKDRNDSEVRRLGDIYKSAKSIAKEYNLTAIYLQQLNRKLEERSDKRPLLSDLRDSGEIEQDADTVTFVYRDDYYNPEKYDKTKASKTELIPAKNRDGESGTPTAVYYDKNAQWFMTLKEAIEKNLY